MHIDVQNQIVIIYYKKEIKYKAENAEKYLHLFKLLNSKEIKRKIKDFSLNNIINHGKIPVFVLHILRNDIVHTQPI